ncbi:uncharacterized protein [Antennarius striatus]|uniref:uncharacterized protein isoform X2 n=1 Tax=Antennarius striatus TaxID=241820 RepID=UPI0035AE4FAF
MIGRLAALIFLSEFTQTILGSHQIPLIVVELGDSFTLKCPIVKEGHTLFYWYKLKLGYMVETVAVGTHSGVSRQGRFNNARFTLTKQNTHYFLRVTNVSKEDEATYLCQSGPTYALNFTGGTILAVKDSKNKKTSIIVQQIPETASVQVGDSIRFQCSLVFKNKDIRVQCPGERSVHWFRAGSGESHPSVIYTHRHSVDEEENKSCVYSLSKSIKDTSDSGTYFCAVVTCGEILFGNGTKVDAKTGDLYPFVFVLGTLLACCVIVIISLIVFRHKRPLCEHCKGGAAASNREVLNRSAQDQSDNVEGETVELNYAALNFSSRTRERWTNNRDTQDCTYSSVREGW